MNEQALLHMPESNYCFATGRNRLKLRLRMQRGEQVEAVKVIYGCKYDYSTIRKEKELPLRYRDRLYDYYEVELLLEDVRLAYIFQITFDGRQHYYSEDGLTSTYDFEQGYYNFFQVPYLNEADFFPVVEWMKSAVFYQIFIDRFYQGNKAKDTSYINMKWGDKPTPYRFAGGDLQGITQKLDYIKGLGANAIYLTPVFSSPSNHKYDIIDYKIIDPQFGNEEALKELVASAHKRGMRVVLDAVFNHAGSQLMQFQDVLQKGRKSPYHGWFLIRGDKPTAQPLNYECFGACTYMPKLNTSNPEVEKFLLDIACHYIEEYDIDGWRLDVSDEISHHFWRNFRREVKMRKPDCVIIGENWHNAYPFLMGDQYDSIMNYSFTKAALDYFAFQVFEADDYAHKLNSILMRNSQMVNEMMLNLLDSHDTFRFYTQVKKDKNKVLAALAVMVCFVGAPCIYYGTEIPMEGGYDPDSRRTFDWNEANHDLGFREKVKELLELRKEKIIREGEIKIYAEDGLLILERFQETDRMVLYYNGSNHEWSREYFVKDMTVSAENNVENQILKPGGFVILKSLGE